VGLALLLLDGLLLDHALVLLVVLGAVLTVIPMELPPREDVHPPDMITHHLILYTFEILLGLLALVLSSLDDDGT
jgi:hypothetical protein